MTRETTRDPTWGGARRLQGLFRFAVAITVLNVVGQVWLGFEAPPAQVLTALFAAYGMELLLECAEALASRRRPCFLAGPRTLATFLLPAHVSGLAVGMLLYANGRLGVVAFAAGAAIASKALFRRREGTGHRHVLNPSNFGIALTLLLFPSVGIAPPYQFTEELGARGDVLLPLVFIGLGTFLNMRFTRRLPLIAAWLAGFLAQALVRSTLLDAALLPMLLPATGVAFLLFTFYMVTDPPTTPATPGGQVVFGFAVASVYGLLTAMHVAFGLFFALGVVCAVRGGALALLRRHALRTAQARPGLLIQEIAS